MGPLAHAVVTSNSASDETPKRQHLRQLSPLRRHPTRGLRSTLQRPPTHIALMRACVR
jgi:hypothetical protein